MREERLPSGQVRRPSKVETFFSASSAYLTLLQRQGPPGFHVFENEFPSCTVRTGRVLAIIVIVAGVLFDRLVQFLWHDSE